MKKLSLVWLIFLLAACGVPAVSTSPPTQEAILVSYPATLKPWVDKFSSCLLDEPLAAIYLLPYTEYGKSISSKDVILSLGDTGDQSESSYLSQIGSEQVVVVVNQENDLLQLSTRDLQFIFTGERSKWHNNVAKSIQVWTYPDGDPLRSPFDQLILTSRSITTNAMLAPDPEVMLEAVSRDPAAIGYLPQSLLTTGETALAGNVKSVQLEGKLTTELNLPVVAATKNEPVGLLREFLLCLQSKGLK